MPTEFITTNAASNGIKPDRKTLKRIAGRSNRPRLFSWGNGAWRCWRRAVLSKRCPNALRRRTLEFDLPACRVGLSDGVCVERIGGDVGAHR